MLVGSESQIGQTCVASRISFIKAVSELFEFLGICSPFAVTITDTFFSQHTLIQL